jgi:beta-1,4-mannosyltransferase
VSSSNGHSRVAVFPLMDKNPYGQLLYRALRGVGIHVSVDPRLEARWLWVKRGTVSILHFHWDGKLTECLSHRTRFRGLKSWFKVLRHLLLLLFARALGYRIVWTIHEVVPHETRSRRRDLVLAALQARASHALVAHDEPTAHRASRALRIPPDRVAVISHGSYTDFYPAGRDREAVRRDWGLGSSTFTFLAFGNLRSYKRIELLLDAFGRLREPDAALLIAGGFEWRFRDAEWERQTLRHLVDASERDPRIRFRLGRVPDEGVAELHAASDAAVFARSDGWTSGSLILALSHGLPAVAARLPAYTALLGEEAAGWLYEPGDPASLASALGRAVHEQTDLPGKAAEARARAVALDWGDIAVETAAVMLANRSPGA